MKRRIVWKRVMAFFLCVVMLTGNFLGTYAAEIDEDVQVMIDAAFENITAVFGNKAVVDKTHLVFLLR